MVVKHIIIIMLLLGLSACIPSEAEKACKRFPEVCQELKKEGNVDTFVSLKLKADQEEFENWLNNNNIKVFKTFNVTGQMLVELNWQAFVMVGSHKQVDQIKLDKLHLIEEPLKINN